MDEKKIKVSALPKTWILDLDGTVVKHNGYKIDGEDSLLSGASAFLSGIPKEDMIVFITSRTPEYREATESFLNKNQIRFDYIIYGAPYGERILINDCKPSGLRTAIALNPERDQIFSERFETDDSL